MRAGLTSFALLIAATIGVSAAETQLRRIYFLESLSPNQPAAMRTIEAFKQRLSEKTTERFEIFIDYMELVRLPSQRHVDQTAEYLAGKYAEAPPDILIALGRAAIPFLAKNRNALAPNVPTIIANVPAREVTKTDYFDNLFFVATEYSFARTLELARQLQPKARNIAVIGGASDYDRQWLDDARRELQPYSDRYTIKYIEGLPYDEMLKQVSQLVERFDCSHVVCLRRWLRASACPARSSCKCRNDFARARLFANQQLFGRGNRRRIYGQLGTAGCSDGGSRIETSVEQ